MTGSSLPRTKEIFAAEAPRLAIARALAAEIVRGALPPGVRLDERGLSLRFGVSRTPVREAIGHLVAQGLVETRARSGNYVARIGLADVLHLFEALAEFEALCARYAARRATPSERGALEGLAEACAAAAPAGFDAYAEANLALHDAIHRAAQNPALERAARDARQRAGVYRRYSLELPGRLQRSVAEHFAIVGAVQAGDEAAAHRLVLDHMDIRRDDYAPFIALVTARDAAASARAAA